MILRYVLCGNILSCMNCLDKKYTDIIPYELIVEIIDTHVQYLHALNSVGISTWQMLQEKYAYAGRWDRWKGYVNTGLHILIGK